MTSWFSRRLRFDIGTDRYPAVFVVVCAALSPASFLFGYHNDFNAWAYDAQTCCTAHPETQILIAIGRYFGAFAQNFQFLTIKTIHDLWIWRLIGVVSIALLAVYYLRIVSLGQSADLARRLHRDCNLYVAYPSTKRSGCRCTCSGHRFLCALIAVLTLR